MTLENVTALANSRISVAGSGIGCGISNTSRLHERESDSSFVLTWIFTGEGFIEEGGRRHDFAGECVILRRPDREYRYRLSEKPSVRAYLDLPECLYETLKLLIPELANLPPILRKPFSTELFAEFEELSSRLERVDQTELYRLLPSLVQLILALTGVAQSRESSPLSRARAMLSDASCRLSLEEVAEQCGLNYNTFRRRFSETYGVSPNSFRIAGRMEAAAQALSAGDTVAEVSERLGFADIYGFTHRFTAFYGVSPAKYRGGIRKRENNDNRTRP